MNVRKHNAGDELGELIASIRSLGIIQPLLVRPNCDVCEVIARQGRLLACQALLAERANVELVPCAILESDDDAVALEAPVAENIARLPMDESSCDICQDPPCVSFGRDRSGNPAAADARW